MAHTKEPLRKLYPHLSDGELQVVEETLDRYVNLIWRIHERLRLQRAPALTGKASEPTISERSSLELNTIS